MNFPFAMPRSTMPALTPPPIDLARYSNEALPPFSDLHLLERYSRITHMPVHEIKEWERKSRDVIMLHPERLRPTLRKLYDEGSPLRYILLWNISAYTFETKPQRIWNKLFDSKFPDLLWDLALDPKTYEPEPAGSEFWEGKVRAYLHIYHFTPYS